MRISDWSSDVCSSDLTIVTGILLSAGEARGESPHVTTVGAFLDELTEDWRKTRAVDCLHYDNSSDDDPTIVPDSALKQITSIIPDNAPGASPALDGFMQLSHGHHILLPLPHTSSD